jgi:hypothetical protein
MSIRRFKNGRYQIRYYETRGRGSQKQETLDAGLTWAEADTICEERLLAAAKRKEGARFDEAMTLQRLVRQYLELQARNMAPALNPKREAR